MAKTRVVKKSGVFKGVEGVDLWRCSDALSEMVALRPGEEVEAVEVVSDKIQVKVTLTSNKGNGQMVYRVSGLSPEPVDIPSLVEARKWTREQLKSNPEKTVKIDKVVLKEGAPVAEGHSELVSRRLAVNVTVTKE